ncbi:MAG: PEP-CTERM sorting domain-containing protein [Alphaproteobacteria bacterium]|jgi:hypothetical protein|nr:PEP-CTERM sorting domain-containing protein [Alphaproteobacteria bacterium]
MTNPMCLDAIERPSASKLSVEFTFSQPLRQLLLRNPLIWIDSKSWHRNCIAFLDTTQNKSAMGERAMSRQSKIHRNPRISMRISKSLACAAAAVLLGTTSAHAALFGVSNITDELLTINPTTGAATAIGSLGYVFPFGIAFDSSGALFGVDNSTDQLYSINTTTGAGTAIGNLGFNIPNSLAFDGSDNLFATDRNTDQLFSINTTTGAGTAIGPVGGGFGHVTGLAFDSSGTLYGVDNGTESLLTINTTTGAGTLVGTLGALGGIDLLGIAFDTSGTLFGAGNVSDQLYTINTTSGVATAVGPLGFSGVHGLSFVPDAVPEPGTLALFSLGLLGLGAARRRQNPAA